MTMIPSQGRTCPECGRPVGAPGMKLCPNCGYPLLLDRPESGEEPPQHKIVHKPVTAEYSGVDWPATGPGLAATSGPGPQQPPPAPGYQPSVGYQPTTGYRQPERMRTPGPQCASCLHGNPPHRKRCERCGAELWQGAASPARWMPQPPTVVAGPPRRRNRWKIVLLVGIPVLAMLTVWALALLA